MIGVSGLGGVPEPIRGPRVGESAGGGPATTGASDDVSISTAGLKAAQASVSGGEDEIRSARVEEARQRIEEGAYQLREVVTQVAARLSRYVE